MSGIFVNIESLTQQNAEEVADHWHYDGEYSFYDMENDREDYEEIISPKQRRDKYFQILNTAGDLVAFFCIEPEDTMRAEIGLGMTPALTGKGLGSELISVIEEYVKRHTDFKTIILSVASFNQRALKVYQRAGFERVGVENEESNGGVFEFIKLSKNVVD
ncbi:GNAT family N-acetyltransferase [Lapidilactobacillus luobeiensis]|uniref:GNAT family N-acetyltransferase n=1 Tax=Lapidilactobacillus luobeiensis TaxID=2950371 RepID=UPI0021C4B4BA|nr:GNAT family protein [Lapidilactobacillus luobeiensis]